MFQSIKKAPKEQQLQAGAQSINQLKDNTPGSKSQDWAALSAERGHLYCRAAGGWCAFTDFEDGSCQRLECIKY